MHAASNWSEPERLAEHCIQRCFLIDRAPGPVPCDLFEDARSAAHARLAYFGFSMGTRFGLGISAALGSALRCAVFGKFGTVSEIPALIPLNAPELALRDAGRITAPVLFHMAWHDEVFPRQAQLQLFEGYASDAKELHAFSGPHARTPGPSPQLWLDFLRGHLRTPE
jgi:Dienelactone hydrolase family